MRYTSGDALRGAEAGAPWADAPVCKTKRKVASSKTIPDIFSIRRVRLISAQPIIIAWPDPSRHPCDKLNPPMLYSFRGLIFLLAACAASAQTLPKPPLNVVLITIDTLRPDHLGCYGYKSIKTPNIDA